MSRAAPQRRRLLRRARQQEAWITCDIGVQSYECQVLDISCQTRHRHRRTDRNQVPAFGCASCRRPTHLRGRLAQGSDDRRRVLGMKIWTRACGVTGRECRPRVEQLSGFEFCATACRHRVSPLSKSFQDFNIEVSCDLLLLWRRSSIFATCWSVWRRRLTGSFWPEASVRSVVSGQDNRRCRRDWWPDC
jgi:hypothetical protein